MKTVRLYSWNVNGFRAIKGKGFDEWVSSEAPDILALQETKISEDKLTDEIRMLPGYSSYWSCAERKGYSGVCVFCKDEPQAVSLGLGIDRFDAEGRTVVLEYPEFVFINCYFPNGQMSQERLDYKLEFYEAFLNKCLSFTKKGQKVVFCGDVNTAHKPIDLVNPEKNSKGSGFLPIEREWIDKVISKGFIDTFREFNKEAEQYSWWDLRTRARERNEGWRIDYFFIHTILRPQLVEAKIHPEVMGSDHCPISITIKV